MQLIFLQSNYFWRVHAKGRTNTRTRANSRACTHVYRRTVLWTRIHLAFTWPIMLSACRYQLLTQPPCWWEHWILCREPSMSAWSTKPRGRIKYDVLSPFAKDDFKRDFTTGVVEQQRRGQAGFYSQYAGKVFARIITKTFSSCFALL